ncbi:MAG: biopolymer transporter ExbD [Puniceicoccales bacterium]|jgi:biopolymer transport protein ExbD|nr:biopolymer transporter ExbD [Puniceicoccales bacterium]
MIKIPQVRRFNPSRGRVLREPDIGVELFGVLNILMLCCTFVLLNSRFILSPGVSISLPSVDAVEFVETMGVITVQSEKFIVFNGNIFSLDTLENGIKKYLRENCAGGSSAVSAILVRPDKSLPVFVLIKICEIAKKSGFSTVQVAAYPYAH